MQLVGFIIEIYYDARSYKRQISNAVSPGCILLLPLHLLLIYSKLCVCWVFIGAEHCVYLCSVSLSTTRSDHLILLHKITVTIFDECEKYKINMSMVQFHKLLVNSFFLGQNIFLSILF